MTPHSVMLPLARRSALFGIVLAGVAACTSAPAGPASPGFFVFFTPFSADLDDEANGVIANASRAALEAPTRQVTVAGYADQIGTAASNQTLSQLRAQIVADALVTKGVDRRRIVLRPKGSVGTDPGVESRRVTIEIN